MGRFQTKRELAIWCAVKGNAEFDEVAYAFRAVLSDQFCDGWIDEPRAGRDGI